MSPGKEAFGNDFKWGVSTAAYQIEGGLGYPIDDLKLLRRVEKYIKEDDEKTWRLIWILLAFKIIQERW